MSIMTIIISNEPLAQPLDHTAMYRAMRVMFEPYTASQSATQQAQNRKLHLSHINKIFAAEETTEGIAALISEMETDPELKATFQSYIAIMQGNEGPASAAARRYRTTAKKCDPEKVDVLSGRIEVLRAYILSHGKDDHFDSETGIKYYKKLEFMLGKDQYSLSSDIEIDHTTDPIDLISLSIRHGDGNTLGFHLLSSSDRQTVNMQIWMPGEKPGDPDLLYSPTDFSLDDLRQFEFNFVNHYLPLFESYARLPATETPATPTIAALPVPVTTPAN